MNKYQLASLGLEIYANKNLDGIDKEFVLGYKKILQELVDRATPYKPTKQIDIQRIDKVNVLTYGICKCNYPVNSDDNKNFCENCGQALDWSEENEK